MLAQRLRSRGARDVVHRDVAFERRRAHEIQRVLRIGTCSAPHSLMPQNLPPPPAAPSPPAGSKPWTPPVHSPEPPKAVPP